MKVQHSLQCIIQTELNIFKVFMCLSALLAAAAASGPLLVGGYGRPAGQVSHQSVSKPYQGEHRSTTQSKAFKAYVAAVADSPTIPGDKIWSCSCFQNTKDHISDQEPQVKIKKLLYSFCSLKVE